MAADANRRERLAHGMIGLVIVSHSAKLAEGVCELAAQVAQGKVRLAAAGGTSDVGNPIGTDAFKVLQAIESVYSEAGVLVLTDLGSAVLSAETALELLDAEKRPRVRLFEGPLIESAVEAAAQAAAGATFEEITGGLDASGAGPRPALRPGDRAPIGQVGDLPHCEVTLSNPLGLHARPAAQFVRLARRSKAHVTIENASTRKGPVDAAGIHAVLSLGARKGHRIVIRAQGPEARQAVAVLSAFLASIDEASAAPLLRGDVAPVQDGQVTGIPGSAGIAIGPLARLVPVVVQVIRRIIEDPDSEWERLRTAIHGAQEETSALYEWTLSHAGESQAGIFDAQLLFLEDPALKERASSIIRLDRVNAEFAWQSAAQEAAASIAGLEDAYLQARARDVEDAGTRVLRRLAGAGNAASVFERPSIVAAHDLTPSEVNQMDPAQVLGLCLEAGSASAHSVILARAMGIPAVVGLGTEITGLREGTTVAVDGERGLVWISPDAGQIAALERRREEWLAARESAQLERRKPAATRDNRRIRVLANISSVAEAAEAVDCGAEGIGVLRSEFLFLGRATAPSEEEQFEAYRAIATVLGQRTLVVRVLDIGGDKNLPYIHIGAEGNPFLGWRGIRVMLGRRDLLKTQLHAILRAGGEVLLPMISSLAELRKANEAIHEVEAELGRKAKTGVMIEVPSAVAIAGELAREADFFSIGTNDLVQYAMAADRTNARVAQIADPFQPAVLRMIRQTIEAGRKAGIGVTLCGELAADTLATPLLIGLGLEEFSVSAPLIPELKRAIAHWTLAEAEGIAHEAMALDSSEAVRGLLGRVKRGLPEANL